MTKEPTAATTDTSMVQGNQLLLYAKNGGVERTKRRAKACVYSGNEVQTIGVD
jgi:hypothetical protein